MAFDIVNDNTDADGKAEFVFDLKGPLNPTAVSFAL